MNQDDNINNGEFSIPISADEKIPKTFLQKLKNYLNSQKLDIPVFISIHTHNPHHCCSSAQHEQVLATSFLPRKKKKRLFCRFCHEFTHSQRDCWIKRRQKKELQLALEIYGGLLPYSEFQKECKINVIDWSYEGFPLDIQPLPRYLTSSLNHSFRKHFYSSLNLKPDTILRRRCPELFQQQKASDSWRPIKKPSVAAFWTGSIPSGPWRRTTKNCPRQSIQHSSPAKAVPTPQTLGGEMDSSGISQQSSVVKPSAFPAPKPSKCNHCFIHFPSRNELHKHLASGCPADTNDTEVDRTLRLPQSKLQPENLNRWTPDSVELNTVVDLPSWCTEPDDLRTASELEKSLKKWDFLERIRNRLSTIRTMHLRRKQFADRDKMKPGVVHRLPRSTVSSGPPKSEPELVDVWYNV